MTKTKRTKFLNLKRKPYGKIKTKKIRIKTILLLFISLLASIGLSSAINWFIAERDAIVADFTGCGFYLNIARAKSFDTIQEEVDYYMDQRNVSDDFKQNLYCLIKNESGWNTEATSPIVRQNGKISIDMGLLQWNSQTAPVKITKACSYNTKCTIDTFVDYIEGGGDWNRWFGWKHNCK